MAEIKTIYDGVPEYENMKKYVDLRNTTIESRKQLVDLCQVFRNPKYETFRVIYMRDDTIVGYESVTSRLPNAVFLFESKSSKPYIADQKGFQEMTHRMYRLGANGYYLMHNHPSGNAKASFEDVCISNKLAKNVKGFKGHLIVDHGTYAWINVDLATHKTTAQNNIPIDWTVGLNPVREISENPSMHIKIKSRYDLANLMYDIKHSDHYSVLTLVDATLHIRLLQEVPNTFINMDSRQIGGFIKNECCNTGSTRAFLTTTDRIFFTKAKELVNKGFLSDCVAYTITKDKAEIVETADNDFVDQNIFDSLKKHDKDKKRIDEDEKILIERMI